MAGARAWKWVTCGRRIAELEQELKDAQHAHSIKEASLQQYIEKMQTHIFEFHYRHMAAVHEMKVLKDASSRRDVELRRNLDAAEARAVLQRQHIQQLEADVAALKSAKEDLQSAKEGLEHQMERWHSDYGKLQEEYDATEEKYKGLEDIVNALTLKRQQSNQKYSFLRAKHNALCEEYRQLAVKLQKGDKAEKDAEEFAKRAYTLELRVAELERALHEAQSPSQGASGLSDALSSQESFCSNDDVGLYIEEGSPDETDSTAIKKQAHSSGCHVSSSSNRGSEGGVQEAPLQACTLQQNCDSDGAFVLCSNSGPSPSSSPYSSVQQQGSEGREIVSYKAAAAGLRLDLSFVLLAKQFEKTFQSEQDYGPFNAAHGLITQIHGCPVPPQRANAAIQTLQHSAAIPPVCSQAATTNFTERGPQIRITQALGQGEDIEQAVCSISSMLSAVDGEVERHQGLCVAGGVLACGAGW